jgi:hypothetical protein
MNNFPYCKICNKYYSSKSSLCNHNKKFHTVINQKNVNSNHFIDSGNHESNHCLDEGNNIGNDDVEEDDEMVTKQYCLTCKFCHKEFTHKNNRWRHEKNCKEKKKKENEKKIKEEINERKNKELDLKLKKKEIILKKEEVKAKKEEARAKREEANIKKEEAKILKLQLKLQNSKKTDITTLNSLNKSLLKHRNMINSNNNTTNNTINVQNNITNNHIQIVGFGKEEGIPALLSENEKRMILGYRLLSLQKLIETVHCGNYNQFKNLIVTNMKDNYMYKYDDTKGVFELATKDDVINTLINYRITDLDDILNEFVEQNKIDAKTKERIEELIEKINYGDENDKRKQIEEIKMLLFNNKDKIAADISLMVQLEDTDGLENTICLKNEC